MKKSPAQDPEKPNSHPLRAVHWLEKTGMDGQVDGPAPDNADEEDDEAEDGIQHAGWASLFLFTRKSHTLTLLTAVVLSVVSGVIIPATSVFLGIIFNSFTDFGAGQITGPELTAKISVQCIALVALGGASWALNGGYFGCWLAFGELQAKTARESVFDEMIGKDMEWFDMQRDGMGGLIPQLQSLTRQLQIATSQPLGFVVQYSVTALAAVGVAFYNSWNLTLVTLATVPIAALILSFISARMQPHIEAQEAGLSNATKFACSAITSITTVKCFTGEAHEIRRFGDAIQTAARSYLKQAHANAMQIGIVRLSILSMFVQGFWYGSTLVGPGGKSAGQILTTFWSALMATQTIEQILPQMIVLEKGRVAGATLTSIISRTAGIRRENERRGGVAPGPCRGGVDLKEISFAYPSSPQQPAIHNASLFFPAGETTFVVGRSGSGKSTIGNLLLRYYSHNEGQIFIDGHPIQTLDLSWLREQITLVQQQTVLFTESLRHNILFGCQDGRVVTDAEVRQACQLALLQHMVNDLPDGLDTPVGMGGDALSGGQKQRVAIARARLRDTPILILDESTSALDYISRSLVMDAIREWRRGKTTIIITHDISQIFEDDYVYVMDAGQVVQEGYRGHLETDADGVFASFAPVASTAPSPVTEDEIQPVTLATSTSLSAEPISRVLEDYATFRASHYSRLSTTGLPRLPAASYRRFSLEPALPDTPLSPPWSPSEDLELVRLARKNSAKIRQSPGSTPLGASSSPATPSSSKPLQRPDSFRNRTRHVLGKSTTGPRRMRSLSSILATVWQVLDGKHRAILILGFVCAFLHAGATPTFSYLFANLLSTFFAGPDDQKQLAIKWSLSVLGVSIGDGLSSYSMHYLLEYSGQAWVDGLRIQAYTRVLQQSQAWFDEEDPSASRIVECLDRNAEEMRNLVGRFVGSAFVAACMTSMAIIWSFAICWKLTIVGLASAPAMYAITRAFETVSGRWESRSNDAAEEAASVFAEVFTTIRVVKALTLEGYFRKKYLAAAEESLRVGLRRAAYSGVFFGLSDSGILFIMGLLFYYGALLASTGTFSTTDILTVFTMLIFSIASANAVILLSEFHATTTTTTTTITISVTPISTNVIVPQINSSRDTATRLLRLAHLPPSLHECTGSTRLSTLFPIECRDLTFRYASRPTQTVLRSLNLTICAGTSTAIVGRSGAGKSTLAALLLALHAPSPRPGATGMGAEEAALTFAGIPVNEVDMRSLRSMVAFVPQTPVLFPGSVRDNIAYGLLSPSSSPSSPSSSSSSASHSYHRRPHTMQYQAHRDPRRAYPPRSCSLAYSSDPPPLSTQSRVELAAKQAGIHTFIASLPASYDTFIGDGGIGLSGGQTQRIAIARALVRQPRLLVLDEATANLDNESARGIREGLLRLPLSPPLSRSLLSPFQSQTLREGAYDGGGRREGGEEEQKDMAIIALTHDEEMMRAVDRIVVLGQAGEVVQAGTWAEVSREGAQDFSKVGDAEKEGEEESEEMKMERNQAAVAKEHHISWLDL